MRPEPFTEGELVEQPALELLAELGWEVVNASEETFGPAGRWAATRCTTSSSSTGCGTRSGASNPEVPELIREEALAAVRKDRSVMDRVRANREVHDLLRDGYRAEWRDDDGDDEHATVRFVDFRDADEERLAGRVAGVGRRRAAPTGGPTRCCSSTASRWCWSSSRSRTGRSRRAYDENLTDYRDTIPAAVRARTGS